MRLYCMEGYQDCEWMPTRPDPRFPVLEVGDDVLCECCYQAALEQMIEELEGMQ